jgi:hypothetical protein
MLMNHTSRRWKVFIRYDVRVDATGHLHGGALGLSLSEPRCVST